MLYMCLGEIRVCKQDSQIRSRNVQTSRWMNRLFITKLNTNVPCREWPWSGRIQPPAESTIRDGVAPLTALSWRGFR